MNSVYQPYLLYHEIRRKVQGLHWCMLYKIVNFVPWMSSWTGDNPLTKLIPVNSRKNHGLTEGVDAVK